jgi:phosphatidylglycerol:prolipoprotein diacylglycerol transferase
MHPVLFTIFGFPISPYGLLIACGLVTGVLIAIRRARKIGIPEEAVLDVVFWGVILGFVGARVAYIAVEWREFLRDPLALIVSRQGFVFLGGLIAAIPVVFFFLRRWRVRFGAMADLLTPPLALAHAFGRTGCFFAGCCYGKVTSMPWGVQFPRILDAQGHLVGSPALLDQVQAGLLPASSAHSLPVHPTQLYDVGIQLTLFVVLVTLWNRRKFHGQIFLIYLWIYPITRIILEFYRGDLERGVWLGGVSTSQILSMLIVFFALGLTLRQRQLFAPADAPVMLEPHPAGNRESPVGNRSPMPDPRSPASARTLGRSHARTR